MMRNRSQIIIGSLVLLLGALFLWRMESPYKPSTGNQTSQPHKIAPNLYKVYGIGVSTNSQSNSANSTPVSPILNQLSLSGSMSGGGQLKAGALKQISALEVEKSRRSPIQQKIDCQLLYANKMRLGKPIAEGVETQRVDLDKDAQGRILVDIKADVTAALLSFIENSGGQIISSFPQYKSIRAAVPLSSIENVAAMSGVTFIGPAVRAMNNNVDSEGDYTHQANTARSTFGVNGSGVKVGVLSDSIDFLSSSQIAGKVTVLSGQSGEPATGEGTAMLEIVNDLAPGAQLYFATALGSEANFASNIQSLANVGCNIIVDDELYNDESPFQDDIVAQAVNSVTAKGVLYFSSSSNAGNQDAGTSGTWEGDFSDGGPSPSPIETSRIHNFATGINANRCLGSGPAGNQSDLRADLFWSDPLGESTNDYDLYIIDSNATTVVASSNNRQSGTIDPYESVGTISNGELIVIVKYSGAGRFLHLSTGRGLLSVSTQGSTRGHDCATNAFGVAAVNAYSPFPGSSDPYGPYPNAFTGGVANPVENFSSDGPRRVFFQSDGTPITPGNLLSSGGSIRQKPDIAAADGITTDLPYNGGLNPFFGTSAAAPHAAAIAALLKSYNSNLTTSQIRFVLTNTALDIMAPGIDRDSGAGIVMALPALEASPLPNLLRFDDNITNTSPHTGDVVTVSITITNQPCSSGGTSAGAFHVGFYFSSNSSFSGVTPFYETAVNGCPSNGIVLLNQNITISTSTAPGIYYLGYKIDDENEVNECNKGDNGIYFWTITVLPPPEADLTISTDSLSSLNPHPGDTITASMSITNSSCTGGSANAGVFHVGFYGLSTTTNFNGLSPFYELRVNGCAANGILSTNLNITVNPTTTPGTYYLGYIINDENEVPECNIVNDGIFYWTVNVQPTHYASSRFTALSLSGSNLIATLSGLVTGENVVVQSSSNLMNWISLKTNSASGTFILITNSLNPSVNSQFFRTTTQ